MFEEWMEMVNSILAVDAEIDSRDLPDQPYRDWFDQGMLPSEGAQKALSESGFYEFDFDEDD